MGPDIAYVTHRYPHIDCNNLFYGGYFSVPLIVTRLHLFYQYFYSSRMLISSSFTRQVNWRNYFSFCSVTNDLSNMETELFDFWLCDRVNFNFVWEKRSLKVKFSWFWYQRNNGNHKHIHQTILSGEVMCPKPSKLNDWLKCLSYA